MFKLASPILLSALLTAAAGAATPPEAAPSPPVQLAQVTIEQRVIIRIPMVRPPTPPSGARSAAVAPPFPDDPDEEPTLRETKGPKCLKLERLRGFIVNSETGVTLMNDKSELFRTHFGRMCRAADFYSGFYIQPTKDGEICAGRDMLHARNGSSCNIERFGKLVPDD